MALTTEERTDIATRFLQLSRFAAEASRFVSNMPDNPSMPDFLPIAQYKNGFVAEFDALADRLYAELSDG